MDYIDASGQNYGFTTTYQYDCTETFYEFLQCPQCGNLSWNWFKYCPHCGTQLLEEPEPTLQDIMNKLNEILQEIKMTKRVKT